MLCNSIKQFKDLTNKILKKKKIDFIDKKM